MVTYLLYLFSSLFNIFLLLNLDWFKNSESVSYFIHHNNTKLELLWHSRFIFLLIKNTQYILSYRITDQFQLKLIKESTTLTQLFQIEFSVIEKFHYHFFFSQHFQKRSQNQHTNHTIIHNTLTINFNYSPYTSNSQSSLKAN